MSHFRNDTIMMVVLVKSMTLKIVSLQTMCNSNVTKGYFSYFEIAFY